ncbi:MAG: glycosyltransferase family 2 protein [Deltaproteobacteria bacterium]|nr:glycosyltransferase family 2 protein [Deltaproteobacteria bacterium]
MVRCNETRVPVLDIVVVNWNAGEYLRRCMESVERSSRDGFVLGHVCVVDNASSDDSMARIESFDLPMQVVWNVTNRGFAAACNQGAGGSQADYLLFLNPDVQLFEDSLSRAVAFMEECGNQDVALSSVQLLDDSGQVARSCARFPTTGRFFSAMLGLDRVFPKLFPAHFMEEWDHGDTRDVDQVMGAFYLVRRNVFDRLGGFDERFFVYFEDVDFAYRVAREGLKTRFFADARVYHKGGVSSEHVKAARLFYSLRSRILYAYKHLGWHRATGVALGTFLVEPATRLAWAALSGSSDDVVETLKGYLMLLGDISVLVGAASQGATQGKEFKPTDGRD